MRFRSNSYHMLISSLPPLPPRFDADRLPISPERLQDRLRMLEPEDAEEMTRMIQVLQWSRQFEEPNDAAVVKRYEALIEGIRTPLVREVLTAAMDVRMITTAMRRRRFGLGPPPIGIGRWWEQIRRHFNQPDFGLSRIFPRITRFASELEEGDVLNCYRNLIEATWFYLKKGADDYDFSFEAVVLYVARWNLLRQRLDLQAERGRLIFETLIKEALGEYGNIYS